MIEKRVYYSPTAEKLEALHKRIREHGASLVEKHGIENLGHFVPTGDNPENKLVFFLGFANQKAQQEAWAAFLADPEWIAVKAASEPDGGLVSKVESSLCAATDYSPRGARATKHGGVFELRTYTGPAERIFALHARFRDHTMGLFEKNGIKNIAYLSPFKTMTGVFAKDPPVAPEGEVLGQLIYMVGHESEAAAKVSWGFPSEENPKPTAFLADFLPIMKKSEEVAGGKLTLEEGGIVSEFLHATDYSAVQ